MAKQQLETVAVGNIAKGTVACRQGFAPLDCVHYGDLVITSENERCPKCSELWYEAVVWPENIATCKQCGTPWPQSQVPVGSVWSS